jgi:hypothetical protein
MKVNVVRDKKTNRIRDQLQEEIEKLREEREVPEMLDLLRQIERANEKLKKLQRRIGSNNKSRPSRVLVRADKVIK